MKELKDYIIPEDLKPGQLPHTLARYDEEAAAKDYMKDNPASTEYEAMSFLMKFRRGRFNPITLSKATAGLTKSTSAVEYEC